MNWVSKTCVIASNMKTTADNYEKFSKKRIANMSITEHAFHVQFKLNSSRWVYNLHLLTIHVFNKLFQFYKLSNKNIFQRKL